ncbi:Tubulin tyrosine ligase [Giardia lamblia P15]|uniref:Tubulin tyrosine ligase n=1 Tax=Giardia intestinalis (strain P15) TaxID=658858 RepID=E1EZL4_GIAIA|nr:Tubulin tyrosine ligase [Giardia lamblia P15]
MNNDIAALDGSKHSYIVCKYSFGPGNNAVLVEQVLKSRPWWTSTEDENDFNLRWQQLTPAPMRFSSMCSTMRRTVFNHLPGNGTLHSKVSLYQILLRKLGKSALDFLPVTYILTVPHEREKFRRHFAALASAIDQYKISQSAENVEAEETVKKIDEDIPLEPVYVEEQVVRSKSSINVELSSTPYQTNMRNLWIVKPIGLNRGRGIKVVTNPEDAIKHMKGCQERAKEEQKAKATRVENFEQQLDDISTIDKIANINTSMSFIVQKYIEEPFLINGRKFDIRTYALITSDGNAYIYEYGYLRLTSAKYSLETTDTTVHLTNNAVQKNIYGYNQFEDGNMLHFRDLDMHMSASDDSLSKTHFTDSIWPVMKRIMTVVLVAFGKTVLGAHACEGCFELFGFDFMIDCKSNGYRPILIEINSNPCLALSSVVSWELLPKMLDDLMDLTIDKLFPPPRVYRDKLWKAYLEARSGKRPSTDLVFTGKPDVKIPSTELRWNGLKIDQPVVTRPNMFTQVMQRWKPCGLEVEKNVQEDEGRTLLKILNDPTIAVYQPPYSFIHSCITQTSGSSTKSGPSGNRRASNKGGKCTLSEREVGRSETSIRRRHPPKMMALSDRSLSNIPKRKSATHETKNVRSQESSTNSSTGKMTLTSDTGSDIAIEY